MGQCVIDDAHGTHKYNMRFSSRHLEFIKCLSRLRVEDSTEYPHKSYCKNMLTVLYSYNNKSRVHTKHIVIKVKLML
jgi:hypothetical protein